MGKITLENIAPYLPFEFSFISEMDKPQHEYGKTRVHTCNGIVELFGDYCLNSKQLNDAYAVKSCLIVLRPMGLTKPIQVEGKEIIPIVELAKISFDRIYFENWLQGDRAISKEIEKNKRIRFWYLKKEQSFQTTLCGKQHVTNQLDLFQWLFKHKFDVFNLIERGLAVDVNTLETNPYE